MATESICNQILDLLIRGIPFTDIEIGKKYQAVNFSIGEDPENSSNPKRLYIELDTVNYEDFRTYIEEAEDKNKFTISGIYLKNNITSFKNYIGNLFTLQFSQPHQLKKGKEFTLEGFTNTVYNGVYLVTNVNDAYSVNVKKDDIPQENLESGLGYLSSQYIGGLNKTTKLFDAGDNTFYYEFESEYFSPIDIAYIDTNKKPYISYLYESILCYSKDEYLTENTATDKKAIIIDTASLEFTPHRSESNKTDANYSVTGATSQFTRNVSLKLYYIMDTSTNSSNMDKDFFQMDRALKFILRRSLEIENGYSSSMTIASASVNNENTIQQGRVVFEYDIEFYISFVENNNVLQFLDGIYPIEKVQSNNDLIVFS